MHAATDKTTLLLQCDFGGQPSVVESSSPFFGASFSMLSLCKHYPTTLHVPLLCSVCHACVSSCACVTRGVLSKLFFVGGPRLGAGEAFVDVSATATKTSCINILTNTIWHNVWRNKKKLKKRLSHSTYANGNAKSIILSQRLLSKNSRKYPRTAAMGKRENTFDFFFLLFSNG